MTQEDWDLYNDLDCSTGEHVLARVGFHDILVEYSNYIAAGEKRFPTLQGFMICLPQPGNRWLCCGRTQQVQLLVELWNHTQPWPRTSTRGLGGTWAMHVA